MMMIVRPNHCDAFQISDQMVCPCGLRWDINDPDPPKCPMGYVSNRGQAEALTKHPIDCGCHWCKAAAIPNYRAAVRDARARGIAVQPLSDRQVSQAQKRLNMLYSEPGEHVWRIVDLASKWFMVAILLLAVFLLGWRWGPDVGSLFP